MEDKLFETTGYIARDKDGILTFFENEPKPDRHGWLRGGMRIELHHFDGYGQLIGLKDSMEKYGSVKVNLQINKVQ
jgi:hypothetical protein